MNATMIEMDSPVQIVEEPRPLSIPLDLSEWVPATKLCAWIVSNVGTLDWTNAELIELLGRYPDFEPKALLNTLTFAYATGVFNGDEIARNCSENPAFRGVRPKLPPVVSDLKQFRKENRGLLKGTLANVITAALKTQFLEGDGIQAFPVGIRRYIIENATERLELARHMDHREDLL
jgi:hypothetical protein